MLIVLTTSQKKRVSVVVVKNIIVEKKIYTLITLYQSHPSKLYLPGQKSLFQLRNRFRICPSTSPPGWLCSHGLCHHNRHYKQVRSYAPFYVLIHHVAVVPGVSSLHSKPEKKKKKQKVNIHFIFLLSIKIISTAHLSKWRKAWILETILS